LPRRVQACMIASGQARAPKLSGSTPIGASPDFPDRATHFSGFCFFCILGARGWCRRTVFGRKRIWISDTAACAGPRSVSHTNGPCVVVQLARGKDGTSSLGRRWLPWVADQPRFHAVARRPKGASVFKLAGFPGGRRWPSLESGMPGRRWSFCRGRPPGSFPDPEEVAVICGEPRRRRPPQSRQMAAVPSASCRTVGWRRRNEPHVFRVDAHTLPVVRLQPPHSPRRGRSPPAKTSTTRCWANVLAPLASALSHGGGWTYATPRRSKTRGRVITSDRLPAPAVTRLSGKTLGVIYRGGPTDRHTTS